MRTFLAGYSCFGIVQLLQHADDDAWCRLQPTVIRFKTWGVRLCVS